MSLLGISCSTPAKRVTPQNRAPTIAKVRDGLSADSDQQESRSSLAANWDVFLDPEGQNVAYEWSIGTSPGATDVMGWHQVGAAQLGSTKDLDLPIGITLQSNIRARCTVNACKSASFLWPHLHLYSNLGLTGSCLSAKISPLLFFFFFFGFFFRRLLRLTFIFFLGSKIWVGGSFFG